MNHLLTTLPLLAITGCAVPHDFTGRATFNIDCEYSKGNQCTIEVPHESDVTIDGNHVLVVWEGVE